MTKRGKIEDARSRKAKWLDSAGRGIGQNKVALGLAQDLGDDSEQHILNLDLLFRQAAIDPGVAGPIQAEIACVLSTATAFVNTARAETDAFEAQLDSQKLEMDSLKEQFPALEQVRQAERTATGRNVDINKLVSTTVALTSTDAMAEAEAAKPLTRTASEKCDPGEDVSTSSFKKAKNTFRPSAQLQLKSNPASASRYAAIAADDDEAASVDANLPTGFDGFDDL